MKDINGLIKLLELEKIEENIYRGESYRTPWGQVFGGQVLAQALHAANQTVDPERCPHSLHGYFILPGDINFPIIYIVEKTRDGGSFSTRSVKAIQKGRPIFNLIASFQLAQEGLDHQIEMPKVTPPEELLSDKAIVQSMKDQLPPAFKFYELDRPLEFRPVEALDFLKSKKQKPVRHVWIKAKGVIEGDKKMHQEILAYASDYNLLSTSMLPHRDKITSFSQVQMASLDHAMWFHRDFKMDDWLLYALDSPSSSNTRGFNRGNVFDRSGRLVASVVQEGLIRPKKQ